MLEARQAIAQQKFETAFFELLKLNREVIELFHYNYSISSSGKEGASNERSKSGYAALNALVFRVFGGNLNGLDGLTNRRRLQFLVDLYKDKGYGHIRLHWGRTLDCSIKLLNSLLRRR